MCTCVYMLSYSHFLSQIRLWCLELCQISAVHHYLSEYVTHAKRTVVCICSFGTRLLQLTFAGCPKYLLSNLQKVQNNATRLIFRTTRSKPTSPLFFILFTGYLLSRGLNTSCLCFKIISHQAPIYLSELFHLYIPSWQLHSSAKAQVFRIPSFWTKSSGQHSSLTSLLESVYI